MEIPLCVQHKLKCSVCDKFLSCGPVYLLHETCSTICGRCSQQSEGSTEHNNWTRIEPYEATASLLAFPCAFATRGCPEHVSFTLGRPPHESNCKFRPVFCPIAPRGSCEWTGSWSSLKEHCAEKHASNVLENECYLARPDLSASNLQTYLISAFNFLFLLHIKVCVASGKLFHSVRMFGDSNLVKTFSYLFKIEGNGSGVEEECSVLQSKFMLVQEPFANFISMNSLMEMLDCKYNEPKLSIQIHTSINFNYLNCAKSIVYVSESKFCDECVKKLFKCEFFRNSCSFVDFNRVKCRKHEEYFCEYQTKCFWCEMNFVGGSFIDHLKSSNFCRKTIKSNINSALRITNTNSNSNFILFSSNNIGTIICQYLTFNSNLYLWLSTSLPSYKLENFKCSIALTDPETKHSQILTPPTNYIEWNDWFIDDNMDKFPSWKKIGIDIKINIDKI